MKIFCKYKGYFKSEVIERITIIFSIILYLGISIIILKNLSIHQNIKDKMLILGESSIIGALSQMQMFILVYLSLRDRKSGYVSALLLNAYGVIVLTASSFISGNDRAFHGIATYFGIFFIVTLIHRYKKNVIVQKKMLLHQYEKLRANEKKLKKMAFFDDLTGVFNRRIFLEEIDLQVEFSNNKKKNFYVVFIDIDNFKGINDTLGHHVGDIVLKEIVNRMREVIHDEDIIGRMGGDEFGILISRKMSKDDVLQYIQDIRILLENTIIVEGREIKSTASFGIAEYPQHGENATELIRNSDIAMYLAKYSGKNQVHFSK